MTNQQGMALLGLLEELLPLGIGLYKQLQATIDDHGTAKFEDLLVQAESNFSHVLKNVQAEKDALAQASQVDTGDPAPVVVPPVASVASPPPPSSPTGSQQSPGSGTAVPPKTV